MSKQIPWLRVFVEGVVIVGSVLLALAADAWWDGREDQSFATEALERLDAEFAEVESVVGVWRGYHEGVIAAAEVLLDHTGPEGSNALIADSVASLIWTVMNVWTLDPPTATLSSLESSGRLGLIGDQEILAELASWRSLLRDLQADEQLVGRQIYQIVYPFVISRVAWRSVSAASGDLPYVGDPSSFPDGFVEVLRDREFEGYIDNRRTETVNFLLNYDEARVHLAKLRSLLQRRLDR